MALRNLAVRPAGYIARLESSRERELANHAKERVVVALRCLRKASGSPALGRHFPGLYARLSNPIWLRRLGDTQARIHRAQTLRSRNEFFPNAWRIRCRPTERENLLIPRDPSLQFRFIPLLLLFPWFPLKFAHVAAQSPQEEGGGTRSSVFTSS